VLTGLLNYVPGGDPSRHGGSSGGIVDGGWVHSCLHPPCSESLVSAPLNRLGVGRQSRGDQSIMMTELEPRPVAHPTTFPESPSGNYGPGSSRVAGLNPNADRSAAVAPAR